MAGLSDKYLISLLNECVKLLYDGKCVFCLGVSDLEVHHIELRQHTLLRWDWRNAILVCVGLFGGTTCHKYAETKKGKAFIKCLLGAEWMDNLKKMARTDFKDHLITTGMTMAEFKKEKRDELKTKIKELKDKWL